jgi:hypothetical protein
LLHCEQAGMNIHASLFAMEQKELIGLVRP